MSTVDEMCVMQDDRKTEDAMVSWHTLLNRCENGCRNSPPMAGYNGAGPAIERRLLSNDGLCEKERHRSESTAVSSALIVSALAQTERSGRAEKVSNEAAQLEGKRSRKGLSWMEFESYGDSTTDEPIREEEVEVMAGATGVEEDGVRETNAEEDEEDTFEPGSVNGLGSVDEDDVTCATESRAWRVMSCVGMCACVTNELKNRAWSRSDAVGNSQPALNCSAASGGCCVSMEPAPFSSMSFSRVLRESETDDANITSSGLFALCAADGDGD